MTAVIIAVLGSTSVGQAVVNAVAPNSVGTAQLRNNAVTTKKVKNGSLLRADFKAGQLPAGPAGPAGAAGAAGPAGPPGVSEYEVVSATSASGSGAVQSVNVSCPAGKKAVGGGANTNTATTGGPVVQKSRPFENGGGWEATGVEAAAYGGNWTTTAWAICAKVS